MARKRFIKPGFFKNDELAKLKPLVRIFFQGLWCWADREGRLENRPVKLKAEIMPYDKFNVVNALESLQNAGFVKLYTATVIDREVNCIQIINFKIHQDVHVSEQQSLLPEPQQVTEKKHGASTVQAPVEHGANTPLNLEPYTLNLESCLEEEVITRETEIENAIDDYFKQPEEEKEKNSAQKEKIIPALNMAIENLEQEHWWIYSLEHYKIDQVERQALFKIFYEQKESVYKKHYPPWSDIASNFYFWIPRSRHLFQNQTNGNTVTKATGKHSNSYQQSKNDVADLMQQSADFLQQSSG